MTLASRLVQAHLAPMLSGVAQETSVPARQILGAESISTGIAIPFTLSGQLARSVVTAFGDQEGWAVTNWPPVCWLDVWVWLAAGSRSNATRIAPPSDRSLAMDETGVRCLTRVRPKRNEWPWYAIAWGPTLFGPGAVHLSWRRLGPNRYQQRILEFSSAEEAVREVDAQVERRHRRGYRGQLGQAA